MLKADLKQQEILAFLTLIRASTHLLFSIDDVYSFPELLLGTDPL